MRVVPTPPYAGPIKSRHIYKSMYDGTVKKCKARFIALGYGQVSGVDIVNTFAPVVKGVTVRWLLDIAFSINMHKHSVNSLESFHLWLY